MSLNRIPPITPRACVKFQAVVSGVEATITREMKQEYVHLVIRTLCNVGHLDCDEIRMYTF